MAVDPTPTPAEIARRLSRDPFDVLQQALSFIASPPGAADE